MMFYVILCDHMDHSFRLPGVAVLGAGATSLGQWRGHKLCLLANGLFQVRDLEIWKGGICVRD